MNLINLLATDGGGDMGHPVNPHPDTVSTFPSWAIALIVILGLLLFAAIIFLINALKAKKISESKNEHTEHSNLNNTKICCPHCKSEKIKLETETHKDVTHIKAICEDCGEMWILK